MLVPILEKPSRRKALSILAYKVFMFKRERIPTFLSHVAGAILKLAWRNSDGLVRKSTLRNQMLVPQDER